MRQDSIRDVDVFQDLAQAVGQEFLAEVGELAFAAKTGTAVVDISGLLEFRCNHAIVICAPEQPAKGEFMPPVLRLVVPSKHGLHLLKKLNADQRRVRAAVEFVFPDELPFVEGILQKPFEIAFCERATELRAKCVA